MSWSELGARARAWRVAHAGWSVLNLGGLAYVWFCAAARRRDRGLVTSIAFLSVEGLALLVGRGNCPMGTVQAEWGDPVPFFELVLPPRAAKAAVPALVLVTLAGFAAVAVRPPRPARLRARRLT